VDVDTLLRTHSVFGKLPQADLEALSSAVLVSEHSAGHVFISEGARGDTVFLVLEGMVEVSRTRGGKRQILNHMKEGDLFGLVALVDDAPRSATCSAEGRCKVGSLPRSVLSLLLNQQAEIAYAFQSALAAQLARDFRNLSRQIRERLAG
jgi:CRP-like cAMP-binding protein